MGLIEKYVFRGNCKLTHGDPGADQTVHISGPCYHCHKQIELAVSAADLEKFRQGNYAERCFPYLSAGEREFLISGICDPCWDTLFGAE